MKWLIVLLLVAVVTVRGGVVPNEGDAANSVTGDSTPEPKSNREKMCEQYGGEGAYQRAREAEKEFDRCLERVMQNMSRESIDEAMENENLPDTLKSYCSRAQDAKYCLSNLTYGLGGCMPPERREPFDYAYNRMTSAAIDYLCFEDGRRVVTFLTTGGKDCWTSKKRAAKQCIPVEFAEVAVEELGRLGIQATQEDCRSVRDALDCIVNLMQSCPEATPALEIKGLLDHMYGILPCSNQSQVDSNV